VLLTHFCCAVHGAPQAPQLLWFDVVSTHVLLQLTNGVVQFALHPPPEHFWPALQGFEHPPQLFTSVCVSKHEVPQRVRGPQSTTQVPVSQSWPVPHVLLHVPQ
jgi:hypothetical protein